MVNEMNDEKKNKKSNLKDIIIAVIPILSFIAVTVGTTYAAYMASVVGNEENGETTLKSARVYAVFNASDSLNMENILPGATGEVKFSIVNTSPEDDLYANYTLAWEIITNEINSENFVYSLEGVSTKGGEVIPASEKNALVTVNGTRRIPSFSNNIGTGTINTGVVHEYTLTIKLLESGISQDELQGKKFEGKVVAKGDPNV